MRQFGVQCTSGEGEKSTQSSICSQMILIIIVRETVSLPGLLLFAVCGQEQ